MLEGDANRNNFLFSRIIFDNNVGLFGRDIFIDSSNLDVI